MLPLPLLLLLLPLGCTGQAVQRKFRRRCDLFLVGRWATLWEERPALRTAAMRAAETAARDVARGFETPAARRRHPRGAGGAAVARVQAPGVQGSLHRRGGGVRVPLGVMGWVELTVLSLSFSGLSICVALPVVAVTGAWVDALASEVVMAPWVVCV